MGSTNSPFLMMTNQMTILTRQGNMIDTITQKQAIAKKIFIRKSTYPRNNANKHGHFNFSPFGIIKKK